jgi:hypothetical protein
MQLSVGHERSGIRFTANARQRVCLGDDMEGVKGLEWDVFLD